MPLMAPKDTTMMAKNATKEAGMPKIALLYLFAYLAKVCSGSLWYCIRVMNSLNFGDCAARLTMLNSAQISGATAERIIRDDEQFWSCLNVILVSLFPYSSPLSLSISLTHSHSRPIFHSHSLFLSLSLPHLSVSLQLSLSLSFSLPLYRSLTLTPSSLSLSLTPPLSLSLSHFLSLSLSLSRALSLYLSLLSSFFYISIERPQHLYTLSSFICFAKN